MESTYDLIIIGGGIAGGGLATVMARAGKSVLVLEKTTEYRDMVRGEWIAPWGVVEAKRTGLFDTIFAAGGHFVPKHVEFGDGIDPVEALKTALALAMLPEIPGPLCIGHPAACNALNESALAAGATVLRGVEDTNVSLRSVSYAHGGETHTAKARLVIGADGRNSSVRGQLGLELRRGTPHHYFSGMLVEGAHGWPEDLQTMGTEGDIQFLAFPQGEGRVRLYMGYGLVQKSRLAGVDGPRNFLDAFRLKSVPYAEAITNGTIAGPCNSIPNEDTWIDTPYIEGAVLLGDAAGYNDPIIGQGLSITMRDVRIVSELLLGAEEWTSSLFAPYGEARTERMRRLRFCAEVDSIVHAEFGEGPQRRRMAIRERRAKEPTFMMQSAAVMIGPEMLPGELFSDSAKAEIMAMGANE